MAKEYKNQNEQIWEDGGTGYVGQMGQAGIEAQKRQDDPTYGQAYTNEGLQNTINTANQNGAGITGSIYNYSQYDTPRTETPGSAAADESHLSDGSYQYIQYCKDMWNKVDQDPSLTPEQKAEQKAYWHNEAEKVRARSGYSGGADGSMFITNGEMNVAGGNYGNYGSAGGSRGTGGSGANGMGGYLDAWQQAALAQSNGQIDYAVAKAVADLERALADAQPQFKEQAESVDRNARQAMDNSALYAEMRGDKGGIGQEQYNSIQNTQAQNHLAVQQAQTKLATDTQRQIADLRAQGEFQKADAALAITQTYLQQLISLEQWAAEYNLSVDQFNASLAQWQAEYDMAMQQFEYGKQGDTANIAWALLEAGIPLSQEQMNALGINADQASQLMWQAQLKNSQSSTGGTGDTEEGVTPYTAQDVYWYLYSQNVGARDENEIRLILNELARAGYINSKDVESYIGAYANSGYSWADSMSSSLNDPSTYFDLNNLNSLGLSSLSVSEIEAMMDGGYLYSETKTADGKPILKWTPGWNLQQYINHINNPAYSGAYDPSMGGYGGMTGPITSETYRP